MLRGSPADLSSATRTCLCLHLNTRTFSVLSFLRKRLQTGGRSSNVLEAGVSWKGTREDQGRKRKAIARKESTETKGYVSCQDVEVDEDKSLKDLCLIPSTANLYGSSTCV